MNPFDSKWLDAYNAKRAKAGKEPIYVIDEPKEDKKPVQAKPERKESKLEHDFEVLWKSLGGPKLEREFRFHEKRRWRFDFCVLANSVAIETEGGVWNGGRHTRGGGFIGDCQKYNQASLKGWRVFRLTSEMITKENVLPIIELCGKQTKLLEDLGI